MPVIQAKDLVLGTEYPDTTASELKIDPGTSPLKAGVYRFQLVVENDQQVRSQPASAVVIVYDDRPPKALINPTRLTVAYRSDFTLSGDRSTDADEKPTGMAQYIWKLVAQGWDILVSELRNVQVFAHNFFEASTAVDALVTVYLEDSVRKALQACLSSGASELDPDPAQNLAAGLSRIIKEPQFTMGNNAGLFQKLPPDRQLASETQDLLRRRMNNTLKPYEVPLLHRLIIEDAYPEAMVSIRG